MAAGNPVGWFELYVQDMPRARRFYEGVLGIVLTRLDSPTLEMWGFPRHAAYGAAGALVLAPAVASGAGGTLIYFSCEDCADEAARVVAFGGRLERAKLAIGAHGHVAIGRDPDGNRIGFHSPR